MTTTAAHFPESLGFTAVSAAMLCLAVCVFVVMNKAGRCGTGVYFIVHYVMSQPHLLFIEKSKVTRLRSHSSGAV